MLALRPLTPLPPAFAEPHPFTAYLRTVGRGSTLSRPLDEAEAEAAMALILEGAVEPVQLGGFLLVLRYRTETPAELAGFVRAARARVARPAGLEVDLDWPSYADRHQQLPYFVLAALLLAGAGLKVLLHGIDGEGPATTRAALQAFGIRPCISAGEAAQRLAADNVAYLPLEVLCPELEALFQLRPLLGLRTPVNSLCRELNPFAARHQIQGVFHPTYLPLHQEAARLLGQPRAAIFKGGGGEAQRNPDKPCRAVTIANGAPGEEIWPALSDAPYPGGRSRWSPPPRSALAGRMVRARSRGGDHRHRRDRPPPHGPRPGSGACRVRGAGAVARTAQGQVPL